MATPPRGALSRFRPYERALFVRQIIVTVLPLACYLLRPDASSVRPILYLAVAATALNFLYYLLHLKGLFPLALQWGRLVLDIVLWTFLLHYTGGPASIFFLGYLVEVLIAAIAISEAGCLGAAILASSAYLVLLARQPAALSWEHWLSRLLTLLLAGVFCQALIRRLEARRRHEAEELRQRLARAESLGRLGEEAAGIVHEVRNTVHGLEGFVSLLKDDLGSEPRGRSLVSQIESGVKGMHDMAEELFARSRGGLQERSIVDLREVIRESVDFATGGGPKRAEISIEGGATTHVTLASRETLRAVFVNLIRNALQATPEGGRILIRAGQEAPNMIRLDFIDTGPGIPPAIQGRIFEPLFTTRADGAGLGLGISRRALEECGGSLQLTRTDADGTTMTVLLPMHEASSARDEGPPATRSSISRSARGR